MRRKKEGLYSFTYKEFIIKSSPTEEERTNDLNENERKKREREGRKEGTR